MRKLRNSIYCTDPNSYLSLKGENIIIQRKEKDDIHIPIHNIEEIYLFSYRGMSPALMAACMERGISICFLNPSGKFHARLQGRTKGNVYLRDLQFSLFKNNDFALKSARNCITGKVYNCRQNLLRTLRDHPMQIDQDNVKSIAADLKKLTAEIRVCEDFVQLRTLEAEAARKYFSVFNEMILVPDGFIFAGRSRRPPLDNVNALLSFSYSLLSNLVTSACESVGLDPYVGVFHTLRPGRTSLSLDLMEELRPILGDRFILSLINRRILSKDDFVTKENGSVLLTETGRKLFLTEWQKRKNETVIHPYLKEKVEWGLIPFIQANLLVKAMREELDDYPPFFWK